MAMNVYTLGMLVRIKAAFSHPDTGQPLDPATLKLLTRDPAGVEKEYGYGTDEEVVRVSAGVYHGYVLPDSAGEWTYRWESTGANLWSPGQGAEEKTFTVRPSAFSGA